MPIAHATVSNVARASGAGNTLATHMKHICPLTYLIRHISLNAVLKAYSTAFDLLGNAACQMR
jgi:hypothetical protein